MSSFAMKKERGRERDGVAFYGLGVSWWCVAGHDRKEGKWRRREKEKKNKEMITRGWGFNSFIVVC